MTRHKVLIVLHADGFIEAYADRDHVDVRTVVMPQSSDETLAEEYLELTLPTVYRDVYFPLNRRAVDNVRKLAPSQIVQQQLDREFLSTLTDLRNDADKEHERSGYDWVLAFDE